MLGGAGCGKALNLCKILNKKLDRGHNILLFPGKNKSLTYKLEQKFKDSEKVKIVPFTPDIHLYLKAADVVLSKPGGLSSTEIAVANVPLVHLKAIPGCETQNKKYYKKNGLSVAVNGSRGAAKATARLLNDKIATEKMLTRQRQLINNHAVEKIIKKVLIK